MTSPLQQLDGKTLCRLAYFNLSLKAWLLGRVPPGGVDMKVIRMLGLRVLVDIEEIAESSFRAVAEMEGLY